MPQKRQPKVSGKAKRAAIKDQRAAKQEKAQGGESRPEREGMGGGSMGGRQAGGERTQQQPHSSQQQRQGGQHHRPA
ncbi:hypothetical protein [Herbidospora sp. RD11066]